MKQFMLMEEVVHIPTKKKATVVATKIDKDEIFPPLRSKIEQRKRDLMTK